DGRDGRAEGAAGNVGPDDQVPRHRVRRRGLQVRTQARQPGVAVDDGRRTAVPAVPRLGRGAAGGQGVVQHHPPDPAGLHQHDLLRLLRDARPAAPGREDVAGLGSRHPPPPPCPPTRPRPPRPPAPPPAPPPPPSPPPPPPPPRAR